MYIDDANNSQMQNKSQCRISYKMCITYYIYTLRIFDNIYWNKKERNIISVDEICNCGQKLKLYILMSNTVISDTVKV